MLTVVIAGDAKFSAEVSCASAAAQRFGYEVLTYDLGGLGWGIPWETDPQDLQPSPGGSFPPCLFKPTILRDAIYRADHLVYTDADAVIVDALDIEGDYDVGVTIRHTKEIAAYRSDPRVGKINAGVLFLQNGPQTREFLQHWSDATVRVGGDQLALNSFLSPHIQRAGDEVEPGGLRVKVFDSADYNETRGAPTDRAKILHFKGGQREKFHDYCGTCSS